MSKVTRILRSKNLNKGKFTKLQKIAFQLGLIRSDVWKRYGSINGLGKSARNIRDEMKPNRTDNLPYKLWATTVLDVANDIKSYRESAKIEVKRSIWNRTNKLPEFEKNVERKRLFTLLKSDKWNQNNFLRRQMRKKFKHGKTNVSDQIVLDPELYNCKIIKGRTWLKVMSFERGKRIAIPLNTNIEVKGSLRLIIKDGFIEIHYAVDEEKGSPCGDGTIGIDKGYTEVFVDSDGDKHGDGLGKLLSNESDYLKLKYQRRNKIKAIARKSPPHKQAKIIKNNLGRKKLNERKRKHTAKVRTKVYESVHSVVDKADTIVCEDLTNPITSKSFGKDQNRRLSGWVKGLIAEAIVSVSRRRGSTLYHVSCAYTSQIDSRYGVLLGERKGDWFYLFDGGRIHADWNAAINIRNRLGDPEIGLYTPYKKIKKILIERTNEFQDRMKPFIQDSSCKPVFGTSTESELPLVDIKL